MKLGVLTAAFGDLPFEAMLDRVAGLGLDAVEMHVRVTQHIPTEELLKSKRTRERWKSEIDRRGLVLSSLSAHGNPVHPVREQARADDQMLRQAIRLAEKLGIGRVNGFSGCPGDQHGARVAETVGIVGPANVHCFREPDGSLPVTDVHPRFGGAFPLPLAAGSRYPELALALARGERPEPRIGEFREGIVMTRFGNALQVGG